MPTDPAAPVLHAVRLLGWADTDAVALHAGLDPTDAAENLLDLQATGAVLRSEFAGAAGWSLTDRGRAQDEAFAARELDAAGARDAVADAYRRFLVLNAALMETTTRWQVRPIAGDPLAANDHTDHRWDDRVLADLAALGRRLDRLDAELAAALPRLGGYSARFAAALTRATRGEHRWVDGVGIDSCHRVWMELHEDLLATLGLTRGDEA